MRGPPGKGGAAARDGSGRFHSAGAMKVLLLQPWIADFAAHNFWIRPLGLYRLGEWLWQRGADVALLDCLSPFDAPGKFPREIVDPPPVLASFTRRYGRYGISQEEFHERLSLHGEVDAVLLTSGMSYWYPGVQWAISEVRKAVGKVPVALGGIYASLWPEHAGRHSGADLVLAGSIEVCGGELASWLGIPTRPIRPFTPWYRLNLWDHLDYAAIRTALGCQFNCSYCASSRLHEGYSPRAPGEILEELSWLQGQGVKQVAFYDDALLVGFQHRLRPVLKGVLEAGMEFTFHTPNGLHARYVTRDVAKWMKVAGFRTIRLSLETVDRGRQVSTGGKVETDHVAAAVSNLVDAGMSTSDIGIYLMMGLPGQSLEEVAAGIEYVKALGVRPYLAEFSPIPGTAEWERLCSAGMLPPEPDPLLTNNSVYFRRYWGYSWEEIDDLMRMARS